MTRNEACLLASVAIGVIHAYPGQLIPLLLVLHLLLDLMDALQGLQALVQQEGGVVNQHVDVAHKLLPRTRHTELSYNLAPLLEYIVLVMCE